MIARIKAFFLLVLFWWHPRKQGADAQPPGPPGPVEVEPAPAEPIPFPAPKAKWAKPKGELLPKRERAPRREPAERREPKPRPVSRPDDNPEQWGQYYFRDAILDQLEHYFVYLKRMKRHAPDAYQMLGKLGIQVMPYSSIKTFDHWRSAGDLDKLSAWWHQTQPGFGAIAYGLDSYARDTERSIVLDLPKDHPVWKNNHEITDHTGRLALVTGTSRPPEWKSVPKDTRLGILWVPKFLYFQKYSRCPADVQHCGGNITVYGMTVFWDRTDRNDPTWEKRMKGGIPQDYAVCIDKATGNVRVLRRLVNDPIKIRHTRGVDRGRTFTIPNRHWSTGIKEYLWWAQGRNDVSPEDYLKRIFIEAALMYESGAQGSMIRVQARKGPLAATFGVDIKRTSYFFKDRDVTLNVNGRRQAIFHIVRPHERRTKKGTTAIPLHFRGMKEFSWAGYDVSITVPGRDHLHIPEIDVGMRSFNGKHIPAGMIDAGQFAQWIIDRIKDGTGAAKR